MVVKEEVVALGIEQSGYYGLTGEASGECLDVLRAGEDVMATMKNGLAFNLPLVILGGLALLLYLFK